MFDAILMYQKSRGPPGPDLWLWALRACSITSFMPFGRSGHVTHAVVQSLDSAFEKSRKITEKFKNNCKEIRNFQIFLDIIPEILPCDAFCEEDEELGILVVGFHGIPVK